MKQDKHWIWVLFGIVLLGLGYGFQNAAAGTYFASATGAMAIGGWVVLIIGIVGWRRMKKRSQKTAVATKETDHK